eukprot:1707175-Alexandrium_andersonii.AAC.1
MPPPAPSGWSTATRSPQKAFPARAGKAFWGVRVGGSPPRRAQEGARRKPSQTVPNRSKRVG